MEPLSSEAAPTKDSGLHTFDDVRNLLEARWERVGYEQLLPEEHDFLHVWWLEAEASNGTLHQYFYNSAGDAAEATLASLKNIGAIHAHEVFSKAIAEFGPSSYPTDRAERIRRLDLIPDKYEVFNRLTDELFTRSEDVSSLAIDRVGLAYVAHGIVEEAKHFASRLLIVVAVIIVTFILIGAIVSAWLSIFVR